MNSKRVDSPTSLMPLVLAILQKISIAKLKIFRSSEDQHFYQLGYLTRHVILSPGSRYRVNLRLAVRSTIGFQKNTNANELVRIQCAKLALHAPKRKKQEDRVYGPEAMYYHSQNAASPNLSHADLVSRPSGFPMVRCHYRIEDPGSHSPSAELDRGQAVGLGSIPSC